MSITHKHRILKKEEGSVLPQPTPVSLSLTRKSLEEHTRCFPSSSSFLLRKHIKEN